MRILPALLGVRQKRRQKINFIHSCFNTVFAAGAERRPPQTALYSPFTVSLGGILARTAALLAVIFRREIGRKVKSSIGVKIKDGSLRLPSFYAFYRKICRIYCDFINLSRSISMRLVYSSSSHAIKRETFMPVSASAFCAFSIASARFILSSFGT